MNLKVHLLLQIILVAILCLIFTGAYVLFQTNRQARQDAAMTLSSIGKYLEMQLIRIDANLQDARQFPDFEIWKQSHAESGVCFRYVAANSESSYGFCQGEELSNKSWPRNFEQLYRWFFQPGLELTRTLSFKSQPRGSIAITPSAEMELARAWDHLTGLLGLSAATTAAVCLLVYLTIYRALRPARLIVNTLEKMQSTDAVTLLPTFKLGEWQCIGTAINTFAETQKILLAERKNLVLQLISVQEEERHYIARELHDEFGQCLSAISALSTSVLQTARQDCPQLIPEVESIAHINQRILETVRTLLLRLRPAELEELGLAASLEPLITEWNKQHAGQIDCQLIIEGDAQQLQKPLPITLYRIIQEGLTNIAKHSNATKVCVTVKPEKQSTITLTIEDNGKIKSFPFVKNQGLGLLGIRERVNGLSGQFDLLLNESGGLTVKVTLPKPIMGKT